MKTLNAFKALESKLIPLGCEVEKKWGKAVIRHWDYSFSNELEFMSTLIEDLRTYHYITEPTSFTIKARYIPESETTYEAHLVVKL